MRSLPSLLLWCTLLSCNKADRVDKARSTRPAVATAAPTEPSARPASDYDLDQALPACEVRHRGLSIDLGTDAADWRRSFSAGPFNDMEPVDRMGASFARVQTQNLAYQFWLDEEAHDVVVSARVQGASARWMNVNIDDRRLGVLKLVQDETKVVALPSFHGPISAGRHALRLSFSPRRSPTEPYAEIDWIRIGEPDSLPETYSAPTLRNIVADVVLNGIPRRSIVLRAPGAVRCPVRLGPNAELRFGLGFWGNGEGLAEVRLVRNEEPPLRLLEKRVSGGGGQNWAAATVDLSPFAGQVAAVELRALRSTGGGRVAFGDARLASKSASIEPVPRATTAVLVIAAGLDRKRIPPWGPASGLASLSELARVGVAFSQYRAPSSVPQAVVATMLTGLAPPVHGVEAPMNSLPKAIQTVSEVLKHAGGRTAMITGVPTSFAPFGFGDGWDLYEMLSPVHDFAATQPYTRAAQWLEREFASGFKTRRLVVIHARGAHPPWDLTKKEVERLKPDDYDGQLGARRGAITLGKIRSRKSASQRVLSKDDWQRLGELEQAAMVKQAAGLSEIVETLKRVEAYNDALLIFVGDVGRVDPPELPYEPVGGLDESRLLVPLIAKFPGGQLAGREVATPVSAVDIGVTLARALGVELPRQGSQVDLYQSAVTGEPVVARSQLAMFGEDYALRLGPFRLSGTLGKVPRLCQLDVDPACVSDVFDKQPLAASLSWQMTLQAVAEDRVLADGFGRRIGDRESVVLDPETTAALTVWGDIQ